MNGKKSKSKNNEVLKIKRNRRNLLSMQMGITNCTYTENGNNEISLRALSQRNSAPSREMAL